MMKDLIRLYGNLDIELINRETPLPIDHYDSITEDNFKQDVVDIVDKESESYFKQLDEAFGMIKRTKELIRRACAECNLAFLPFLGRFTENLAGILFLNDDYLEPGNEYFIEDKAGFLEYLYYTVIMYTLDQYTDDLGVLDQSSLRIAEAKFNEVFHWKF